MTEKRLQKMYNFGVRRTDLFYSTVLSNMTGANVFIKREDLQENKSFKIRGAINNMLSQIKSGHNGIFACASTGNHAQGFALGCAKLKRKGIVFMPTCACQIKIDKTKHFGGDFVEIQLVGDNFDDCLAMAEKEKENGYCFIHPYDDVNTIEGQATLMEEVKAQLAEKGEKCDLVFSPVGGGGLISGIINVVEKYNMNTKVVGCQTELCHPLTKNFEKNENLESQIDKTKEVITDGSLVKKLGSLTWNIINNAYKNGEFALEVLENDKVLYCMGMAKIEHNIDVEGAGGLSFAGFLQYVKTHDVKNKNVVLVNSGGNVLPEMQQKAIAFYKKNRSVLV